MIKIDLHIHSDASAYKESSGIVDNSTKENVHCLLEKLKENDVSLFSITDHNRFNFELYKELETILSENLYPSIKGLLAGVEFDVSLDEDMRKCHIITIFNAKNNLDNYKKIHNTIEEDKLIDKNDYYSKKRFENILNSIGLDVILIAHQKSDLGLSSGKHNSLSESTKTPYELISVGYINALEFHKPKVEGILINNLKNLPRSVSLVTGSDCHTWELYPNHSRNDNRENFVHTKAKILPTFKGLLMAITSPETRINLQENSNREFINNFEIDNQNVSLKNGINAIIGENGSGKSTLIEFLHDSSSLKEYMSKIISNNRMNINTDVKEDAILIRQGEIVKKFEGGSLFDSSYYQKVDDSNFENAYKDFANKCDEYIKNNIRKKSSLTKLKDYELEYKNMKTTELYYVYIEEDLETSEENIHEEKYNEVTKILNSIKRLSTDDYMIGYKKILEDIFMKLETIQNKIYNKLKDYNRDMKLRNIIISEVKAYKNETKEMATSSERDNRDYLTEQSRFIATIVKAIRLENTDNQFPKKPDIIENHSSHAKYGFNFNVKPFYHNKDVFEDFLKHMFTKDYRSIENIKSIDNESKYVEAVMLCTSYSRLEDDYEENLNKFIKQMCFKEKYIVDVSQNDLNIGNTLGQLSLAYFKYMFSVNNDKDILIIDQPEDHISNNNISNNLIKYINSIRYNKQIIIATHNPLLVVNLDVDNIIFVRKENEKLVIKHGCLEYEDDKLNILDVVADNMDGGKESIEKRLKVYGK